MKKAKKVKPKKVTPNLTAKDIQGEGAKAVAESRMIQADVARAAALQLQEIKTPSEKDELGALKRKIRFKK
jgi:hypothetical protein